MHILFWIIDDKQIKILLVIRHRINYDTEYLIDGADPRFFESNVISQISLRRELEDLRQKRNSKSITERKYQELRQETFKRYSRLPYPLHGLSNDQVITFISEAESLGSTYITLENSFGKEAALNHLAGDIANSNFTETNLKSAEAATLITEKFTNFGKWHTKCNRIR